MRLILGPNPLPHARFAALLLAVCILSYASKIPAADSAITLDSSKVFLCSDNSETSKISVCDLNEKTIRTINPESIGAPAGFQPRATSKSGFLLGDTPTGIYAVDLAKKKSAQLYALPDKVVVEDIAYNPKDGATAAAVSLAGDSPLAESGFHPMIYVPQDPGAGGWVFCRRVTYPRGLSFSPKGLTYFAEKGDIWEGEIAAVDTSDQDAYKFVLTANRLAPVGTHETYMGTPMGIGAAYTVVTGSYLYFQVLRMGGSGMAAIGRLTLPKTPPWAIQDENTPASESPNLDQLSLCIKRYTAVLASYEPVTEHEFPAHMCVTLDGSVVFYLLGRTEPNDGQQNVKAALIKNAGKPTMIELKRVP